MIYVSYLALLISTVVFVNLNHPIGLGLALIVHTLLVSVITGLIGGHFWFSYILFLVFLGGVLVLFIYMTSLAANEKFEIGWGSLISFLLALLIIGVGLIFMWLPLPEAAGASVCMNVQQSMMAGLGSLVMKLYSVESYKITAVLVVYLLYALLVCANIVSKYSGALRNFN